MILDFVQSIVQDPVRNINVIAPVGNSDHNAIKVTIYVNGELPKSIRGNLSQMRGFVKKKLERQGDKFLQESWKLFRTTTVEA